MPVKPQRAWRAEAGISLVEVLVAMSIFGVVLLGLTGALIAGVRSVGDQRLRTAANRVAIDHLETLRGLTFEQLDAEAGTRTATTPDGRAFTIETTVARVDAATGSSATAGGVKQITAVVSWTSGGTRREVSYTTAVADDRRAPTVQRTIGTIIMFPSPAIVDANGQPLQDVEVTLPLVGFTVSTLVQLSWSNADGTAGAKTLTSTTGVNWRGTIAKEQVRGAIGADGGGEVHFTASAGSLVAAYTLALQRAVLTPPLIIGATISRIPVTVAKPAGGRTCAATNQCQNTTEVVFRLTVTGLDPAQDSVVLQYELHDGTFHEVALAPVSGTIEEWALTVRSKTTKFRPGIARAFRFTAIRSADGAADGTTVLRDVVSV